MSDSKLPEIPSSPNGPHARELGAIGAHLQAISHRLDGLHDDHSSLKAEIKSSVKEAERKIEELSRRLDEVRQRMFYAGATIGLIGVLAGGALQKYGALIIP